MNCRNYLARALSAFATPAAALTLTMNAHAYVGSTTPKLRVSGRFLQDTSNKNVLLHGWMQPTETWFNGEGNRYSNPTDWNNTANVAGMLNFLPDAATVMSDTSPKYGRSHGWYNTFVRVNTDSIGGWTQEQGLVNASQFNGWIQNFLVPYANHLRSRGLYLVLCATGPINRADNGTQNTSQVEQQRLITFWQTVANAPGIKSADNIMFELMNEPVQIETSFGANNWGSGSGPYFQAFRNFMQPVINAARNTGADNVIWVPCLGWQGEPHGWAQYPFTGSNIGVAAHYYPAYGGVHNNTTAVQNLWNSNYKPAADRWPMMITECMWFPNPLGGYDDLFNGTTAGFGNALKTAMDNQGNVQYLVGFLADHLVTLASSTPANCTLGSHEGTKAYFAWLPTYTWAAPTGLAGSGGGAIANGTYRIVARHSGKALDASNNGTANGTQIIQWAYGGGNNQRWTVTNRGNNQYSIIGVQSGRCVEVSNWGTANGTKVQLWDWLNGTNQKFAFTATSGGYHRITPTHATGSCLDVSGVSTADGALVHLLGYGGGNNQQWAFQATRAHNLHMRPMPLRKILATLFLAVCLTAGAAGTSTTALDLAARIEKARAEEQVDQCLRALAGIAKDLPLSEVQNALTAADRLKSLRERLASQDSVLKRWGELAPAEAFAHISKMAEGLSKVERSVAATYGRTNGSAAAVAALKMKPGRAQGGSSLDHCRELGPERRDASGEMGQ